MSSRLPRTPCIGVCSTGIGDDVCRGCKRFAQEVIDWNGYGAEERQAVLDRLDQLLAQTVQSKFEILDQDLLLEQIRYQQLRCDTSKPAYCWIFELLRHGAGQISDLSAFGLRLQREWRGKSLPDIKAQIDREFYELSCAYYERYILPGQRALST